MSVGSFRRLASVGAVVVLAGAAWMLFSPQQLGGSVGYVITSGSSMEPQLHGGDLVIVRRAGRYRVSDVIAYASAELGQTVLHRIIRMDGGRFVTKGDNNGWVDSDRPRRDSVLGKLWFRVPAAGKAITLLRSPRNAGFAAGLLALLVISAAGAGSTRRRRQPRKATRIDSMPRDLFTAFPMGSKRLTEGAAAGLAVGGLVCLLFGVLAFARPASGTVESDLAYSHSGSFGYSATVPKSPVYDGPRLATGDPVFLRLVDRLAVRFAYRFESEAPHAVSGSARLLAELSDTNGWKRTVTLQPRTPFTGGRATLEGTLSLRKLRALLTSVEAATGVVRGGYTLSLLPELTVTGAVAGKPIEESFEPRLAFHFDQFQLQPQLSPAGQPGQSGEVPVELHPRKQGSVSLPRFEAGALKLLGAEVGLGTARAFALLAGLALLAAALGLGLRARRQAPPDEPTQIRARYRSLLIPVSSAERVPGKPLVEVASADALARLADQAGRPMLHLEDDEIEGVHSFFIEDDAAVYRYRAYASEQARESSLSEQSSPPARQETEGNGARAGNGASRSLGPVLVSALLRRNNGRR